MSFLLDTSICSIHLKAGDESPVFSRMIQYGGRLHISRLTVAELYAYAFRNSAKIVAAFDDFVGEVKVVEFDGECARRYGMIHASLAERNIVAPSVDLMLAVTAVVNDFTLVTHDGDFRKLAEYIDGLQIEDWV